VLDLYAGLELGRAILVGHALGGRGGHHARRAPPRAHLEAGVGRCALLPAAPGIWRTAWP
jgi:hypothetical protein